MSLKKGEVVTKDLLITPPKQIRKWSDRQLPVRKSKPTVWMYFYFLWKPWLNTLLCFYFVGIEEETWQCSMAQDQDKRRFSWIFSTDRKLVPNALKFSGAAAWPTKVFLRWDMRKVWTSEWGCVSSGMGLSEGRKPLKAKRVERF